MKNTIIVKTPSETLLETMITEITHTQRNKTHPEKGRGGITAPWKKQGNLEKLSQKRDKKKEKKNKNKRHLGHGNTGSISDG